jgi:hypothetical protein
MQKRFELQKLVTNDPIRKLKVWQRVIQSDDIQSLKIGMTNNHRIVDTITKNVVLTLDEKEDK